VPGSNAVARENKSRTGNQGWRGDAQAGKENRQREKRTGKKKTNKRSSPVSMGARGVNKAVRDETNQASKPS
jgi:hypothetical protein